MAAGTLAGVVSALREGSIDKLDLALLRPVLEDPDAPGDALEQVFGALARSTNVHTLDCWAVGLSNDGCAVLARHLRFSATLVTVDLGANGITDDGASSVAVLLQAPSCLRDLALDKNQLGDAGARCLADALDGNTNLTALSLKGNRIGNDGAAAFALALQTNTTLVSLDLFHNEVGTRGGVSLAEGMHRNTSLSRLELGCNLVSNEASLAAIAARCRDNASRAAAKDTSVDSSVASNSSLASSSATSVADATTSASPPKQPHATASPLLVPSQAQRSPVSLLASHANSAMLASVLPAVSTPPMVASSAGSAAQSPIRAMHAAVDAAAAAAAGTSDADQSRRVKAALAALKKARDSLLRREAALAEREATLDEREAALAKLEADSHRRAKTHRVDTGCASDASASTSSSSPSSSTSAADSASVASSTSAPIPRRRHKRGVDHASEITGPADGLHAWMADFARRRGVDPLRGAAASSPVPPWSLHTSVLDHSITSAAASTALQPSRVPGIGDSASSAAAVPWSLQPHAPAVHRNVADAKLDPAGYRDVLASLPPRVSELVRQRLEARASMATSAPHSSSARRRVARDVNVTSVSSPAAHARFTSLYGPRSGHSMRDFSSASDVINTSSISAPMYLPHRTGQAPPPPSQQQQPASTSTPRGYAASMLIGGIPPATTYPFRDHPDISARTPPPQQPALHQSVSTSLPAAAAAATRRRSSAVLPPPPPPPSTSAASAAPAHPSAGGTGRRVSMTSELSLPPPPPQSSSAAALPQHRFATIAEEEPDASDPAAGAGTGVRRMSWQPGRVTPAAGAAQRRASEQVTMAAPRRPSVLLPPPPPLA